MKQCVDCLALTTKTRCKPCGYKFRKRPSGLKYNIVAVNKGWFEKGHVPINITHKANSGSFKPGERRSIATEFKPNQAPWNKGIEYTAIAGDKHPLWKGDNAQYSTKHQWVYHKLGKPNVCSKCEITKAKRFEWHNISGKYLRNTEDWIRLCSTCHGKEHKKINLLRKEIDNA